MCMCVLVCPHCHRQTPPEEFSCLGLVAGIRSGRSQTRTLGVLAKFLKTKPPQTMEGWTPGSTTLMVALHPGSL